MIDRDSSKLLKEIASSFKAIAITGHGRAEKPTLTKHFSGKPYLGSAEKVKRNFPALHKAAFISWMIKYSF